MAKSLSQEQQAKIDELFEKFKNEIYGELKNNFTTSNVKTVINKYMGKIDQLYYRNELDKDMSNSLEGKLFELSGELQRKAAQEEVKNIDNPLEKNQFISEEEFQEKLTQWLKAYREELEEKKNEAENGTQSFTYKDLIKFRENCLKGQIPFEEFKILMDKKALSNEMQKIVIDKVDEITKEYMKYVSESKETDERSEAGIKLEEKIKEKYEKNLKDLIARAENTRDNLNKATNELVKEVDSYYERNAINEIDIKEIKKTIKEIYNNYKSSFNEAAYEKAQEEKIDSALTGEVITEEDFNNSDNVLDKKGILYATMDFGKIKQGGAYKIDEGFEAFKKGLDKIPLEKAYGLEQAIKSKSKHSNITYPREIKKDNIKYIVSKGFENTLVKGISDLYLYGIKKSKTYYSSEKLCFKENWSDCFKLYETKQEFLEKTRRIQEHDSKPKDSFVHLKFKFDDGTIIECLDNENKSRDEVLAEAKKVYEQMKRSR